MKVRMSFRFDETDVKTWKRHAMTDGLTLSEWMRRKLNEEFVLAHLPTPVNAGEARKVVMKPDEDEELEPFVATAEDPAAMRQCKHGIGAGIYCPRCGRRV